MCAEAQSAQHSSVCLINVFLGKYTIDSEIVDLSRLTKKKKQEMAVHKVDWSGIICITKHTFIN